MDLQLRGARALVAGSSSGIGEGMAKTLALEGAAVISHGRDRKRIGRIVSEIFSTGEQAVAVVGYPSTAAGCEAVGRRAGG